MKKLLALVLTLVMLCMLTIPAFADSPVTGAAPYEKTDDLLLISPAPSDTWDDDSWYIEWAKTEWAETCEEEPELTAQFLTELDGWFAREYPWYDSFEEYCQYYCCPEEAYLDLFRDWSREYIRQRERDDFITSHGGVPGQFNVMVNGAFLPTTAQRPVYIDNGVTYADAQALSQTLGIPVTANEAGYAPVRATAEALGCMVCWDSVYNAAVVVDPAVLAEKIDSKFTILNQFLDNGIPAKSNCLISGESDVDLTIFNSLDGDMTRQASFAYDLIVSPSGVSGSVDYDLSLLWDLLQAYIPALLIEGQDDGYEQQVALLTALLSGRMDVRADLDAGTAYLSLPSFLPNTWLRCSLEELDMDAVRELYDRPASIGQLLCTAAQDSYVEPARICDSVLEAADQAAALVGDEKFVRSGTARVLTLTRDDIMAAVGEEMDTFSLSLFSLTLRVDDNGSMKADLRCRVAAASDGISLGDVLYLAVSGTRTGGKTQSTSELHIRNVLKLVVKEEHTLTATQKVPELAPPRSAVVIDADVLDALEF